MLLFSEGSFDPVGVAKSYKPHFSTNLRSLRDRSHCSPLYALCSAPSIRKSQIANRKSLRPCPLIILHRYLRPVPPVLELEGLGDDALAAPCPDEVKTGLNLRCHAPL